jgi:acyl carrier protein
MHDIPSRLATCFRTVFPDLPDSDIPSATQQSVSSWDSVGAITLANVIEEEFQIEIDFDDMADLDSYSSILNYLQARAGAPAA